MMFSVLAVLLELNTFQLGFSFVQHPCLGSFSHRVGEKPRLPRSVPRVHIGLGSICRPEPLRLRGKERRPLPPRPIPFGWGVSIVFALSKSRSLSIVYVTLTIPIPERYSGYDCQRRVVLTDDPRPFQALLLLSPRTLFRGYVPCCSKQDPVLPVRRFHDNRKS